MSALAGVSGMGRLTFTALSVVNLAVRAVIVLGFAEWLREYVELVLAWIRAYWVPATAVTVLAAILYQLARRRGAAASPGPGL